MLKTDLEGRPTQVKEVLTEGCSQSDERSFAYGANFYKIFWIFFIGCFIGVIIETAWCVMKNSHYASRVGLIYGPFNLVYGFGAVVMTLGLEWLQKKSVILIFLIGSVIGSAFEYVCSFVQESIFGTISWNYAKYPCNLNGRINLLYSVFWGILAVVWIRVCYPALSRLIEKIPNVYGKQLTWVLLAFMVFNVFMSACAVGRMSARRNEIDAKNGFEVYLDSKYPDERLEQIFPNMRFPRRD